MTHPLRSGGVLGAIVQTGSVVRKELVELVRRPRLVLTLVVGPFLLLVVFGNSYRQNGARLRTVFVGPSGSGYEEALDSYAQELAQHVRVERFTTDEAGAREDLVRGRVDLVVVFPADAAADVLAGRHAEVVVLNDKIDPVQRVAVDVAARLAVQEVNAAIVAHLVHDVQARDVPVASLLAAATEATGALGRAVAAQDPRAIDTTATAAGGAVAALRTAVRSAAELTGAAAEDGSGMRQVDDALARIESSIGATREARNEPLVAQRRVEDVRQRMEEVRPRLASLAQVDSAVLVRPFVAVTRTVLPQPIGVTAFFAPSSIALLLQHFALSFVALSIVRDRQMGMLEVYRVGPASVLAITVGRLVAFVAAGGVVGTALLVAVHEALDVPVLGSLLWLGAGTALLLGAAIALGMLLALVSGGDSEVVQFAMLVLLASLFFGGFVLDLGLFDDPGRALSWVLPVTFAIRILQDVMLRDTGPSIGDVLALGAQIVVYGLASLVMFRRRLRTA